MDRENGVPSGGCISREHLDVSLDLEILRRLAANDAEDESKPMRKSHDNPAVQELYWDFLGKPLGHISHELLHTPCAQPERRRAGGADWETRRPRRVNE